MSSLHLLPLGQSISHSGPWGAGLHRRGQGVGIRLALAPGGPILGGRWPKIEQYQQYRQPAQMCSKHNHSFPCTSQEGFELQAQSLLLLVGGCACILQKAERTLWPEGAW